MIFGTVLIRLSEGSYLAHSQLTGSGRIAKGTEITAVIVQQLAESGIEHVVVAQLEDGDVHEDAAAQSVAAQFSGDGLTLSNARTGRVNLLAAVDGLCHFNAQSIIDANCVDEGITIATLPENCWVAQGRMVATIKIIPYAVSQDNVQRVLNILEHHTLSVAPAIAQTAEIIQTRLRSVKETTLDKTSRITQNRLAPRQVSLVNEWRCDHTVVALSKILNDSLMRQPDWILIVGASAISDRADVIPEAIRLAGGEILRFGIPVDPGNLLLLARKDRTLIIGLPGCARSPRYNGLDMILDRLACQIDVTDAWLSSLSVGGLLTEIADRPAPRISLTGQKNIGIVVLAAGASTRAGTVNKLLVPYNGIPMVTHVVNQACQSQATRVVAVTGHDRSNVELALAETSVDCVFNSAHASGMASSVVAGVSRLADTDALLVCLGDMPHVTTNMINLLIEAFQANPDKSVFVPLAKERYGNPVLFSKVFFDTLLALKGDIGAKKIMQQYPHEIHEVPVGDTGVLVDYDTLADLEKLNNSSH